MRGAANGIAWEDRGRSGAPPLILIRPLGGSAALWGRFADDLASHFRVVTFDARGSGISSGSPRCSIRGLADDACSVLDACGIDRASVFGISLGGMVAQRLAISSSSRVRALVLASTAARGIAFERAGLRRAAGFAACLTRSSGRTERCLVRRVLSPTFRDAHAERANQIADLAARVPTSRATIVAHAFAALRHDASAELASVRARTLVLAGDQDHLLGAAPARKLARCIPNAKLRILEGAGHDLTLEAPDETARAITEFLQEN